MLPVLLRVDSDCISNENVEPSSGLHKFEAPLVTSNRSALEPPVMSVVVRMPRGTKTLPTGTAIVLL